MADRVADNGLSEERIRVRAYEIFLRRGGQGGSPESDWLLAREELQRENAAPALPDEPEPTAPAPKKSVRTVRSTTASRRSR